MLFHSIIPLEVVFGENNSNDNKFVTRMVQHEGCQVEVMTLSNGQNQIVRIHSTNPRDYLHPDRQPGANI